MKSLVILSAFYLASVSSLHETKSVTSWQSLKDPSTSSSVHSSLHQVEQNTEEFEFENGPNKYHRRDSEGEHDSHDDKKKSKPWGSVFLGTILVNLATLSGVVVMVPAVGQKYNLCKPSSPPTSTNKDLKDILIPYFAAGALLATVIFLVLPESLALIQSAVAASSSDSHDDHEEHGDEEEHEEEHGDEHDEHGDEHSFEMAPAAVWRFGTSLCFGYLFPIVLATFFPRPHGHGISAEHVTEADFDMNPTIGEKDIEIADGADETSFEEDTSNTDEKKALDWGLILSILVGDGFHNFCDGIFIGVAFMLCDITTAYAIVASTIYHEVAQEVADFFLLTKHAGLSTITALGLNFIAGLSVVLGGVLVLAIDISDMFIGVILAFTAGVYLQISVSECIPRAELYIKTRLDRALGFLMFAIGAVPIGIISTSHTHCGH